MVGDLGTSPIYKAVWKQTDAHFNLTKDRLFESGLSCYETQYWGKDTSFRKLDLMALASQIFIPNIIEY